MAVMIPTAKEATVATASMANLTAGLVSTLFRRATPDADTMNQLVNRAKFRATQFLWGQPPPCHKSGQDAKSDVTLHRVAVLTSQRI